MKQTLLYTALATLTVLANPLYALQPEISGTVEAEYTDTRTTTAGISTRSGNGAIATLELGIGLPFNDRWRADIVLLAEDIGVTDRSEYLPTPGTTDYRPDEPHIEEAFISYQVDAFSVQAGRYTLPFGSFGTAVISDPQTLEIGETASGIAATLGMAWEGLSAQVTRFEGNLRSSADDEPGFSAGIEWQAGDDWRLGGGYLSAQGAGKDAPALWNLYLAGEVGPFGLHAEYVAAGSESNGERPRGWSLDAGYAVDEQWALGARWQQTERAGVLDGGDGEYRELAAAVFYSPLDYLTIGLEYADGSEGTADMDQWLLQVAASF